MSGVSPGLRHFSFTEYGRSTQPKITETFLSGPPACAACQSLHAKQHSSIGIRARERGKEGRSHPAARSGCRFGEARFKSCEIYSGNRSGKPNPSTCSGNHHERQALPFAHSHASPLSLSPVSSFLPASAHADASPFFDADHSFPLQGKEKTARRKGRRRPSTAIALPLLVLCA